MMCGGADRESAYPQLDHRAEQWCNVCAADPKPHRSFNVALSFRRPRGIPARLHRALRGAAFAGLLLAATGALLFAGNALVPSSPHGQFIGPRVLWQASASGGIVVLQWRRR
jgi:hypothetical protein